MGRACCLPRPWRRARVVAGGLRRQARNTQGPGSQAHVIGGWSVVVGGLPPASLCACPAAARPGAVPLLGVRWLLLPGLSRPPAPGLWRSFRAGQRVGCPPWFMPWLSPLPGWLLLASGSAFVRLSGPAAPPGPLLRGCVVVLRLRCRWVGAGAQARKGGLMRRPTDHAALVSPALCSPRRTRPKEAGQDPGGSRERMPPGLPSGPVGLALQGRLTVQKKSNPHPPSIGRMGSRRWSALTSVLPFWVVGRARQRDPLRGSRPNLDTIETPKAINSAPSATIKAIWG